MQLANVIYTTSQIKYSVLYCMELEMTMEKKHLKSKLWQYGEMFPEQF